MNISKKQAILSLLLCFTIGFLLARYGIYGKTMLTAKQCMQALERNCHTYGVPKAICDSGFSIGEIYE